MPVLHSDLSTHCARTSVGLVCTTESCAGHGRVSSTRPWAGFFNKALSWTWTCLEKKACCKSSLLVLLLESGLIYIHYRHMCCTWTCLHTGAWASPGRVYTTDSCAAPRPVSSTGALAAPGRFHSTESCASHRCVYFTGASAAPGRVYTSSTELLL
jgi:hypothetical protein